MKDIKDKMEAYLVKGESLEELGKISKGDVLNLALLNCVRANTKDEFNHHLAVLEHLLYFDLDEEFKNDMNKKRQELENEGMRADEIMDKLTLYKFALLSRIVFSRVPVSVSLTLRSPKRRTQEDVNASSEEVDEND